MLISVDKLWKSANEHPADSGYHYCIAETPSGCEFRQLVFFSIVHKAWEGVQEDTVKFWLPHIPSPTTVPSQGSNKFISIHSEVILEEDELGVVIVNPPEGEGNAISVNVRRTDEGVSVSLYPKGQDGDSCIETWMTFAEVNQEVEEAEARTHLEQEN